MGRLGRSMHHLVELIEEHRRHLQDAQYFQVNILSLRADEELQIARFGPLRLVPFRILVRFLGTRRDRRSLGLIVSSTQAK
jgi:hypothetical protein